MHEYIRAAPVPLPRRLLHKAQGQSGYWCLLPPFLVLVNGEVNHRSRCLLVPLKRRAVCCAPGHLRERMPRPRAGSGWLLPARPFQPVLLPSRPRLLDRAFARRRAHGIGSAASRGHGPGKCLCACIKHSFVLLATASFAMKPQGNSPPTVRSGALRAHVYYARQPRRLLWFTTDKTFGSVLVCATYT